ncbi:MAG: 3-deoxy-8-phosphooctulonate synthase [Bacteroidales bacterium]
MNQPDTSTIARILPGISHGNAGNFFLIAGPCVVESERLCMETARHLKALTDALEIPYVFKASYRKANRSRLDSFTGIGDREALEILTRVGSELGIPVVTDVHSPEEAERAAESVDMLQIPAFLCRQTDLLVACARTGKAVSIKKGQFLSPEAMGFAAAKIRNTGNNRILLTERGTTFGYHDLVVDFRSIPIMRELGHPVVLDVTHSLQQPNQESGVTGGRPDLIATLARCGIASGADGLFMETHPEPSKALSDGANMLPLHEMEGLLTALVRLHKAVR